MRAVDHYRKAEDALAALAEAAKEGQLTAEDAALTLAGAQVHATLAVAGAHALNAYSQGDEQELDDWAAAAGGAE